MLAVLFIAIFGEYRWIILCAAILAFVGFGLYTTLSKTKN